MPSTLSSLHYHIVFSTKDREPSISIEWRDRLHEYLGGITRSLEGIPQAIGGVADHVHLLVGLNPSHRVADFVRDMKRASSLWIAESLKANQFKWQKGYAVFSVSASSREAVKDYISRQEDHHRKVSFRDELLSALTKSGVSFDERYLD